MIDSPYQTQSNAFPNLAPIYTWAGWTTLGTIVAHEAFTEDFNGDGRDDIAVHFLQMQKQGSGQVVTGDALNRLVVWLAQPDGTYLEATKQLFGSEIVILPGHSRKVDGGDINNDGRPDWIYAINREDGRSTAVWDHAESQTTASSSAAATKPDAMEE